MIKDRVRLRNERDRRSDERKPSVLLVDPDRDYRRTLRALLVEAGIHVVAETGNGAEAEVLATRSRPDVVVLEVALDDRDGFGVARSIRACDPEVQVIILTNREGNDVPLVFPAGGLYVAAFLWKSDGTNWLIEAVRRACPGRHIPRGPRNPLFGRKAE